MIPFLYVDLNKVVFSISMTTPEICVVAFLAVSVIVLYMAHNKNNSGE